MFSFTDRRESVNDLTRTTQCYERHVGKVLLHAPVSQLHTLMRDISKLKDYTSQFPSEGFLFGSGNELRADVKECAKRLDEMVAMIFQRFLTADPILGCTLLSESPIDTESLSFRSADEDRKQKQSPVMSRIRLIEHLPAGDLENALGVASEGDAEGCLKELQAAFATHVEDMKRIHFATETTECNISWTWPREELIAAVISHVTKSLTMLGDLVAVQEGDRSLRVKVEGGASVSGQRAAPTLAGKALQAMCTSFQALKAQGALPHANVVEVLRNLNALFIGISAEDLQKESSETTSALRTFIDSFLGEKGTNQDESGLALGSLLSLDIVRGKFLELLLSLLRWCQEAYGRQRSTTYDVLAILRQWTSTGVDGVSFPYPASGTFLSSFTIAGGDQWVDPNHPPTSVNVHVDPAWSSLTTDSSFLYICSAAGIRKVGTGERGTIAGKVYARRSLPNTNWKGHVAFLHGYVLYRVTRNDKFLFRVFRADDLEECDPMPMPPELAYVNELPCVGVVSLAQGRVVVLTAKKYGVVAFILDVTLESSLGTLAVHHCIRKRLRYSRPKTFPRGPKGPFGMRSDCDVLDTSSYSFWSNGDTLFWMFEKKEAQQNTPGKHKIRAYDLETGNVFRVQFVEGDNSASSPFDATCRNCHNSTARGSDICRHCGEPWQRVVRIHPLFQPIFYTSLSGTPSIGLASFVSSDPSRAPPSNEGGTNLSPLLSAVPEGVQEGEEDHVERGRSQTPRIGPVLRVDRSPSPVLQEEDDDDHVKQLEATLAVSPLGTSLCYDPQGYVWDLRNDGVGLAGKWRAPAREKDKADHTETDPTAPPCLNDLPDGCPLTPLEVAATMANQLAKLMRWHAPLAYGRKDLTPIYLISKKFPFALELDSQALDRLVCALDLVVHHANTKSLWFSVLQSLLDMCHTFAVYFFERRRGTEKDEELAAGQGFREGDAVADEDLEAVIRQVAEAERATAGPPSSRACSRIMPYTVPNFCTVWEDGFKKMCDALWYILRQETFSKNLKTKAAETIARAFLHLDVDSANELVELIIRCRPLPPTNDVVEHEWDEFVLEQLLLKMRTDMVFLRRLVDADCCNASSQGAQETRTPRLFQALKERALHPGLGHPYIEIASTYSALMFSRARTSAMRTALDPWMQMTTEALLSCLTRLVGEIEKPLSEIDHRLLSFIKAYLVMVMARLLRFKKKKGKKSLKILPFCRGLRTHLLRLIRTLDEKNSKHDLGATGQFTMARRIFHVTLQNSSPFVCVIPWASRFLFSIDSVSEASCATHAVLHFFSDRKFEKPLVADYGSPDVHTVFPLVEGMSESWLKISGNVFAVKLEASRSGDDGGLAYSTTADDTSLPLCVEGTLIPLGNGFHELEAILMHLLGQCSGLMLRGSECWDGREKVHALLRSKLLSLGAEPFFQTDWSVPLMRDSLEPRDAFLLDMLLGDPATLGGLLATFLHRQITHKTATGRQGGDLADQAERAVAAILLKHNGLTSDAMAFARNIRDESEKSLLIPPRIEQEWRAATTRVRMFLVHRLHDLKKEMDGTSEEVRNRAIVPFGDLVDGVVRKSLFLLQLQSALPAFSASAILPVPFHRAPSAPEELSLVHPRTQSLKKLPGPLSRSLYRQASVEMKGGRRRGKSTVGPVARLWSWIQKRVGQPRDEDELLVLREKNPTEAVVGFVLSNLPLEKALPPLISSSRLRLRSRIESLYGIQSILSTVKMPFSHDSFLALLLEPLQSIQEDGIKRINADVRPYSREDIHNLEGAFHSLFNLVRGLLDDKRCTTSAHALRVRLLDTWRCAPFSRCDHDFIHTTGLFDYLRQAMRPPLLRSSSMKKRNAPDVPDDTRSKETEEEDELMEKVHWHMFAIQAMEAFIREESHDFAPTKLQEHIVDILLEETQLGATILSQNYPTAKPRPHKKASTPREVDGSVTPRQRRKSEVGTVSIPSSTREEALEEPEECDVNAEFFIAEDYSFRLVTLLAHLLGVRLVPKCCCSLNVVQLLTSLVRNGTPRVQRSAVRVCRKVLPFHLPNMLGRWERERGSPKKLDIIPYLMSIITRSAASSALISSSLGIMASPRTPWTPAFSELDFVDTSTPDFLVPDRQDASYATEFAPSEVVCTPDFSSARMVLSNPVGMAIQVGLPYSREDVGSSSSTIFGTISGVADSVSSQPPFHFLSENPGSGFQVDGGGSLFGNSTRGGGLFGNSTRGGGLFGNSTRGGGGLFGNSTRGGSLFAPLPPTSGSLFGNPPPPTSGSLFGNAPPPTSGSLFGNPSPPTSGSLFGNAPPPTIGGGGRFVTGPSIFGSRGGGRGGRGGGRGGRGGRGFAWRSGPGRGESVSEATTSVPFHFSERGSAGDAPSFSFGGTIPSDSVTSSEPENSTTHLEAPAVLPETSTEVVAPRDDTAERPILMFGARPAEATGPVDSSGAGAAHESLSPPPSLVVAPRPRVEGVLAQSQSPAFIGEGSKSRRHGLPDAKGERNLLIPGVRKGVRFWRGGYVEQCLTSEVVLLMRMLYKTESWKEAIGSFLRASLSKARDIVQGLSDDAMWRSSNRETGGEFATNISRLIAALMVLGGHGERLRVGSMVEIDPPQKGMSRGTVIAYRTGASCVTVMLGDTLTEVDVPCVSVITQAIDNISDFFDESTRESLVSLVTGDTPLGSGTSSAYIRSLLRSLAIKTLAGALPSLTEEKKKMFRDAIPAFVTLFTTTLSSHTTETGLADRVASSRDALLRYLGPRAYQDGFVWPSSLQTPFHQLITTYPLDFSGKEGVQQQQGSLPYLRGRMYQWPIHHNHVIMIPAYYLGKVVRKAKQDKDVEKEDIMKDFHLFASYDGERGCALIREYAEGAPNPPLHMKRVHSFIPAPRGPGLWGAMTEAIAAEDALAAYYAQSCILSLVKEDPSGLTLSESTWLAYIRKVSLEYVPMAKRVMATISDDGERCTIDDPPWAESTLENSEAIRALNVPLVSVLNHETPAAENMAGRIMDEALTILKDEAKGTWHRTPTSRRRIEYAIWLTKLGLGSRNRSRVRTRIDELFVEFLSLARLERDVFTRGKLIKLVAHMILKHVDCVREAFSAAERYFDQTSEDKKEKEWNVPWDPGTSLTNYPIHPSDIVGKEPRFVPTLDTTVTKGRDNGQYFFQHICCMPLFVHVSAEELRWKHVHNKEDKAPKVAKKPEERTLVERFHHEVHEFIALSTVGSLPSGEQYDSIASFNAMATVEVIYLIYCRLLYRNLEDPNKWPANGSLFFDPEGLSLVEGSWVDGFVDTMEVVSCLANRTAIPKMHLWSLFKCIERPSDVGEGFLPSEEKEMETGKGQTSRELEFEQFCHDMNQWTFEEDRTLVDWMGMEWEHRGDNSASQEAIDSLFADPLALLQQCSEVEMSPLSSLKDCHKVPKIVLAGRIYLIKTVWRVIPNLLKIVTENSHTEEECISRCVTKVCQLVLYSVKVNMLSEILGCTDSGGAVSVTLNRREAAADAGCDPVFVQAYHQLHFVSPAKLGPRERAFRVNFVGEGASDAGGPYRDAISTMCNELQSNRLKLLIPTPNNREQIGENVDQWLPNPSATSPEQLSQFEFLGKLMGIAIRTGNPLNLDLTSSFWKKLCGAKLTRRDLREMDGRVAELLRRLEEEEEEEATHFCFTTVLSDCTEVELVPGGRQRVVTPENAREYAHLVEHTRFQECSKQIASLKKGLATLIPAHFLSIFSWDELQRIVCGRPTVDVEELKRHVEFSGTFVDVDRFWRVMGQLTEAERCLFVRFTCGLSRLPHGRTLQRRLRISPEEANDDLLPRASTCSWNFILPSYSSEEIMLRRIRTALSHCVDIDADYMVNTSSTTDEASGEESSGGEEEEEEEEVRV